MVSDQLAKCVLVLAAVGGMPRQFWATDRRIRLACNMLGWSDEEAFGWAQDNHDWTPEV